MRSSSRDTTDFLRGAGGMLFAAGCVVLSVRKSSGHQQWSDFALLLVASIPAILLYTLALSGSGRRGDESNPSDGILMVAGILLAPLAFLQLLRVLGVESLSPLETAAVFAFTGLLAAYGAFRGRVTYAALLAGLALLVAWLIVWSSILGHPSATTFRVLLIGGAAVLFLAATRLERAKVVGSSEIATSAGVAAVAAGAIGVVLGTIVGIERPLTGILASTHASGPAFGPVNPSGLQNFGWDAYLLLVSLALVSLGSRVRSRGLGYVGGLGTLVFLYSICLEVTRIESGKAHTSSLVGWPLALLLLGAVGLAAPVLARRES